MKNLFIILSLLLPFNSIGQCNTLVWSDEFDGTSLNTANWNYEYGAGGWGNSELQYYTDDADNISVGGGILTITAESDPNYNGSGANFTSARITTRNKQFWTYGRMEARIRLPQGEGLWPAFWMLDNNNINWPVNGEIDIMEYRGDLTTKTSAALHYGDYSPNNLHDGSDYFLPSGNFYSDFHVFAIEWEVGEIRWYVDGNLFKTETETPATLNPASNHSETWPWDNDFFIILNMAVGGWYTGTTNDGDIELTKPTLEVDYVRVYSDPLSLELSGPTKVFENQTAASYTSPTGPSYTFNWTVPSGATIANGQGTDNITVDWGDISSSGNVHCDVTPPTCSAISIDHSVTVFEDTCRLEYLDFDVNGNIDYFISTGQYSPNTTNPAPDAVNGSSNVAKYDRNGPDQYDYMKFRDLLIDDATEFENGNNVFIMDVYTSAPVGTQISINMENEALAASPFPSGRRSTYNANTIVANAWQTLTFTHASTPDLGTASDAVDNLTILFNPDSYTNHTYYFDNFHREQTASCDPEALPPTADISGNSRALENYTEKYQTVFDSDYGYTWSVPTGATIVSGQGTFEISVQWSDASSSGNVQVDVTSPGGNVSDQFNVSVIDNACDLFLIDFDGNELMTNTFSDGVYTPDFTNPASNSVNSSANCGKYTRNAAVTWDVIAFDDALADSADLFESEDLVFKMDVNTDAPIGTEIVIQLENTSLAINAHPTGRRSSYSATTTTQNEWEQLTFNYTGGVIDAGTAPEDINRVVFLFDGGNNTNNTYHFDNLFRTNMTDPTCAPVGLVGYDYNIKIYPNPATNEIRLVGLKENISLSVINAQGQQVISTSDHTINVSQLPVGVYHIVSELGSVGSFVKN